MKNDAADSEMSSPADPEISASDHVANLVSDLRVLAASEIDYYRARLVYGRSVAKWTGLYLALSLFMLFGAVVGLILGLLITVSQVIGAFLATIAIFIGFLIVGFIFALLARRSSRNFQFPELSGNSDE
jgi:hypothetical protein